MRHISFGFAIALAAILMIAAGCEKEVTDKIGSNEETDGPATVTLGVQIATDTKTYIDADSRTPMWINDDILAVNSLQQPVHIQESNGSSAKLYNVQEAEYYYAIYPYDIVRNDMSPSSTTILLDNVQTYKEDGSGHQIVEAPMAAYSTTTSLTFHNLGALLRVRFTNDGNESIKLSEIKVKGESYYLCGYGLIENITGTDRDVITMTSSQYSYKDVSLDFGNDYGVVNAHGTKDFYVVLPAFAEQSITVTLKNDATHYATFTGTKALAHNKIATVKFKASDIVEQSAPLDAINGLFTINSNGDQVYFSRGNLQCTLTADKTCKWTFAENQWDFIGNNPGNTYLTFTPGVLSSYPGTVDIFEWSTDNTDNFYGVSLGGYSSGSFKDWGTNSINGNLAGSWRTPKASEWTYITQGRTDTYKYMKCNVHGVYGIILFPDGYSHPSKLSASSIIVSDGGAFTTAISDTDWDLLEGVGCVFMPAAGARSYLNLPIFLYANDDEMNFIYWMATANDENTAYYSSGKGIGYCARNDGSAVRLVQDK